MFEFLLKLQKNVEKQIETYLELMAEIMFIYKEAANSHLKGDKDAFNKHCEEFFEARKKMDETRQSIIMTILEKSLMPDSREDILELLGLVNKILEISKNGIRIFLHEDPEIPENIHSQLNNFFKEVCVIVETLKASVHCLFTDMYAVHGLVDDIINEESHADDTEFQILNMVFSSDLALANKLQIKRLIRNVAGIADQAEETAQNILIFVTRRKV